MMNFLEADMLEEAFGDPLESYNALVDAHFLLGWYKAALNAAYAENPSDLTLPPEVVTRNLYRAIMHYQGKLPGL